MIGNQLRGASTLLYKEVLRFWKVSFQTVAAPVLTAPQRSLLLPPLRHQPRRLRLLVCLPARRQSTCPRCRPP